MRLSLRPYQKEAISAVLAARNDGHKRLLITLPTGAGKTVIFSELCRLAQRTVLVLAHREELLQQASVKITQMTEGLALVGVEQGDRHAADVSTVVVASIRSLRTNRLAALKARFDFGLVIYDECHHSAAEDNARVLRELGVFERQWTGTLVGFTATTTRADGLGLDTIFERIVYAKNTLDMIAAGYLVPLRGYRISTDVDITDIGSMWGDEELSHRVNIEDRNALVARSIQELARDRRTLVFCTTVNHAVSLARALRALGIPTGVVFGDMKKEDRARTLRRFRDEQLMCLTNVMVLTEGFDDPGVSCIAMARPTRSESLYTQCVGRGARLHPGKEDCIVLDFVDLSDLSLVNLPSLFGLPKDLNLDGEDLAETVECYKQLRFDFPGFAIEAGEITLKEVITRAEVFNPLTMELHPEITAITINGWQTLGEKGVALHFISKGKLSTALILRVGKSSRQRYQVFLNDSKVAHFSKLIDAVEAVDFEIDKMGLRESNSAREDAAWRLTPITNELQAELRLLSPPRNAATIGDALGYLVFAEHNASQQSSTSATKGWPPWWAKKQT